MEDNSRMSYIELHRFASDCLCGAGVPKADAEWTAYALLAADLQDRASHGISRLSAYIRGIQIGKINPTPSVIRTRTALSAVTLEGDDALGPVIAKMGIEEAMVSAKEAGVGVTTVKRGNHAGALGIYTSLAAEEGFIAVAMTNAQPAIPPWGGRTAFFGTNPIAMSAGRGDEQITVDLATSIVARGNIILAAKAGKPIPAGWAIDTDGIPTTDAVAALAGAVLPMAGPKGYSLALMVEVFAGVLSGAAVGSAVGSIYDDREMAPNTGMFFLALNPDVFVGRDLFESRLGAMEKAIHESPTAKNVEAIYLPGERRRTLAAARRQQGIPISKETISELEELAQRFSLAFPEGLSEL